MNRWRAWTSDRVSGDTLSNTIQWSDHHHLSRFRPRTICLFRIWQSSRMETHSSIELRTRTYRLFRLPNKFCSLIPCSSIWNKAHYAFWSIRIFRHFQAYHLSAFARIFKSSFRFSSIWFLLELLCLVLSILFLGTSYYLHKSCWWR